MRLGLMGLAPDPEPASEAQNNNLWYRQPITGIGTNIWAPEWYPDSITKFDAEKLADSLARAGVQVAYTFQGFSRDHFGLSYYPTRMGPMHRNLNGRDHLREYTEALHKRNIKILGYYSFPDKGVWERNPDWRQIDADGKEIRADNLGGPLCPNSPYRDYFLAGVTEIVRNYDLDGFMLDTAGFSANEPGCYCRYCQRKFRERYGRDLPHNRSGYDPEWQKFVQFRFDSMQEFYRDVHDTFKSIRPQMLFTHNAFALRGLGWGVGEDYERSTRLDDIVTSIGSWDSGGPRGSARDVNEIWKTGMLTRYLRGLSGKPVWMQTGAYIYNRDYQALPVQELKLAAYAVVANGGSPVYITNAFPDGTVDTVLADRIATVLPEVSSYKQYLDNAEDMPFAALYYSLASHVLTDSVYQGENRYRSSFEGAYKALIEEHVPFDIVGAEGLASDRIAKYKALVLPDAVAMSDEEADVLRKFVESGGDVIATSRTSLLDTNGAPRKSFALADLFGADYENPLDYDTSFIKPESNPICEGIDLRENIPLRHGQQVKVLPRPDAETAAKLMLPATEIIPGIRVFNYGYDVAPGPVTEFPAIVTHSFGKGRSVYFAGDLTGAYGRFGDPSLRKLLRNAIRWVNEGPLPLETDAPLAMELRSYRQRSRYLVHLMNYITGQLRLWGDIGGTAAEDVIPVRDISVQLRIGRQPSTVYLASNKQALPFTTKNGVVSVRVPKVDVFDMLVVE
jgi:hypothetical protein